MPYTPPSMPVPLCTMDGCAVMLCCPFVRVLQLPDVELLHLQHGFGDALRARAVGALHHLPKDPRDDLPGEAEPVLEPAALLRLAAFGQLLPEEIHFLLGIAVHHEREGRREGELRPAVEG